MILFQSGRHINPKPAPTSLVGRGHTPSSAAACLNSPCLKRYGEWFRRITANSLNTLGIRIFSDPSLTFRPFSTKDYPEVQSIYQPAYPREVPTVECLRHQDQRRDPRCQFKRVVVEKRGQIIAVGEYDQIPQMYHPQKFRIRIAVHPDHQREGIGSSLYEHLMVLLKPLSPISIRTLHVPESFKSSIRFLEQKGFVPETRLQEWELDTHSFDFSPYRDLEEQLRQRGIEIKSVQELQTDPQRDQKLYDLECSIGDLTPSNSRASVPFDHFRKNVLENPRTLHDAYFIAVKDGEYIGGTLHWTDEPGSLLIYATGVRPAYRKSGIAFALKIHGIHFASIKGYSRIVTTNDMTNSGIISINERIGFVRREIRTNFQRQ